MPVPARLAGLGAFALATLCVIIALFVIPDGGAGDIPGVDTGHGFGYWASLVVIIAGLVLSLMRFQQTGGQLPGGMGNKVPNIGHHGPQGGLGSGPQPGPGTAAAPAARLRPAAAVVPRSGSGCRDALARPGIRLCTSEVQQGRAGNAKVVRIGHSVDLVPAALREVGMR